MKRLSIVLALVLALLGCSAPKSVVVTEGNDGSQHEGGEAIHNPSAQEIIVEGRQNEEYLAAGLTYENNMWYYQQKFIAALYDHDGGIYTNDMGVGEKIYIEIRRNDSGNISEVVEVTKEQLQELMETTGR